MFVQFCFVDPRSRTHITMNPQVRRRSDTTAKMKNFLWPRQVVISVKKE